MTNTTDESTSDESLPYWLPYCSFLVVVAAADYLPASMSPWMLPLKVILPATMLLVFALRSSYPELRGYRPEAVNSFLDVLVGVVGAAMWVAPYLFFTALSRPDAENGFDPQQLGASLVWLALGLRMVGYGLVTPFMEELFLRSWLQRFSDVFDTDQSFRSVPIARFTARSFLCVLVWFTLTHQQWEWPVAVPWLILTQLWFYHRGHLMAIIIVHAVTNLSIFLFVLLTSRQNGSLWYFL